MGGRTWLLRSPDLRPNQFHDPLFVRRVNQSHFGQSVFAFLRLLSQDVIVIRMLTLDLSGTG